MSFGSHAYQHRYYNQPLAKNSDLYSPTIQSYHIENASQYNQSAPHQYPPSNSKINLRTRAGVISKNSLGW